MSPSLKLQKQWMIFYTAPAYFISQCGAQAVSWNTKYQERVFISPNASEYSKSQQWRDVRSTRKSREYISPSISHWLTQENRIPMVVLSLIYFLILPKIKVIAIYYCSLVFLRLPFGKNAKLTFVVLRGSHIILGNSST